MRSFIFCLLTIISLSSFLADSNIFLDKDEAQKAFRLLNDIRTNPENYYNEFRFSKNLRINHTKLNWNSALAKAAEAKAYDMAKRNYFNHIDPDGYGMNYYIEKAGYELNPQWTGNKRNNFFESIEAGAIDANELIKLLIIDKGEPTLGHRKHLLGVGDWNASLVDIGIGFVRTNSRSPYHTYVSILIAKHN